MLRIVRIVCAVCDDYTIYTNTNNNANPLSCRFTNQTTAKKSVCLTAYLITFYNKHKKKVLTFTIHIAYRIGQMTQTKQYIKLVKQPTNNPDSCPICRGQLVDCSISPGQKQCPNCLTIIKA